MKNKVLPLIVALLTLSTANANAALIDRGDGLIYDTVLDVTWLQNANMAGIKMDWSTAVNWAENLTFGGFDDWRLPTLTHSLGPNNDKDSLQVTCGDGRFDMDASGCDFGWNSTSVTHELAYMFSVNLGNQPSIDALGRFNGLGGLNNVTSLSGHPVSFLNVQSASYWYGNEYTAQDSFFFAMHTGGQFVLDKSTELFAWAVRDGDITTPQTTTTRIPEPSTLLLFAATVFLARHRKQSVK